MNNICLIEFNGERLFITKEDLEKYNEDIKNGIENPKLNARKLIPTKIRNIDSFARGLKELSVEFKCNKIDSPAIREAMESFSWLRKE